MKKTVIAVIACLVLIAVVLLPVWQGGKMRLQKERFTADLAKASAESAEAGTFTADIGDRTYAVGPDALDAVNKRLNYAESARQPIEEAPEAYAERMTLRMGDKCTAVLYALDEAKNDTAVLLSCEGRTYRFRLDGYRVYGWVEQDIVSRAKGEAAE